MFKTLKRLRLALLSIVILIGSISVPAGAKEAYSFSTAKYDVYVSGGSVSFPDEARPFEGYAKENAVLEVTLDSRFSENDFSHWLLSDGTKVPEKTFRFIVRDNTVIYPIFNDITLNFGDWVQISGGTLCTENRVFMRTDEATGFKDYRFEEAGYHYYYESYSKINDNYHSAVCVYCGYRTVEAHSWNSGTVIKEATHYSEGLREYVCYDCYASKTEAIPKTDEHSFIYASYYMYSTFDNWVTKTPAVGATPGKRREKCEYCNKLSEQSYDYISSKLPTGKKIVYKYESTSALNKNTCTETHYITDNAYAVDIDNNYGADYTYLYFSGNNSPVYVYSTYIGDWAIIGYADNMDEFISIISEKIGINVYSSADTEKSRLYSTLRGYKAFEYQYNYLAYSGKLSSLKQGEDKVLPSSSDGKKYRYFKMTPSETQPYYYTEYYVDENNTCYYQFEREYSGINTTKMSVTDLSAKDFPYSEPEREKINHYGFCIPTDGTYGGRDVNDRLGIASPDWSDEKRTVKAAVREGEVFSHWLKYNPRTWEWEYYSAGSTFTPTVTDVTAFRPVYKERTYKIKIIGGYYTMPELSSLKRYTEGEVPYGKKIEISWYDNMIPEGKQLAGFKDKNGILLGSYQFVPKEDNVYTAVYEDKTAYVNFNAENGIVKANGEEKSWGEYKVGERITLTTEGNEGTEFLGWFVPNIGGKGGEDYTLLSTDTTLNYTVPSDSTNIYARWIIPGSIISHDITGKDCFIAGNMIPVSAVRTGTYCFLQLYVHPGEKRTVTAWKLLNSEEAEILTNTYGYLEFDSSDPENQSKGFTERLAVTAELADCGENHQWDAGTVTKYPTLSENGIKTHTCTVCGAQKTEKTDRLTFATNADFTVSSWDGESDTVTAVYPADMTDEDIMADMSDGRPVNNYYMAAQNGAATNAGNRFAQGIKINDMPQGNWKIAVYKKGGYLPSVTTLDVEGESCTVGELTLRKHGDLTFDGVTDIRDLICGKKQSTGTGTADMNSLGKTDSDTVTAYDLATVKQIIMK